MLLGVTESLCQLKWRHFWLESRQLAELEAFDAASRGPWGALVFPFKTRFKSYIALLGAAIMVATLAMEPLAQQIVSFETCYRSAPLEKHRGERSGVNVSQAFDLGTPFEDPIEPFRAAPEMQGAFFDGIFNVRRLMPTTCLTGNCTWPKFLSLGICSFCEGVTDDYAYNDGPCDGWSSPCVKRNYTGINTAFNLSNDHPYTATLHNGSGNTLVRTGGKQAVNVNDTGNFGDTGTMVSFVLGRFNDYTVNGDVMKNTPELTRCNITWCAKLYQKFTYENTTESYMPYDYTGYKLPLTRKKVDPESETVVYTIDPAAKENLPDTDLDKIYDETFKQNNDEKIFEVNKNDYVVLSRFLGDMLGFHLRDTDYDPAQRFPHLIGRALLLKHKIPAVFDMVANGMSIPVQQYPDNRNRSNQHFVDAIAMEAKTCIHIWKRWFIVPGALNEAPSWKSATLPLLFHGLDGWDEYNDDEVKMMLARAKGMLTKLEENEEGNLKFVKV
ncbi:hypothetical protein GTA08_BOTSDO04686 [Botryosphaeria dothidea]|uniref:Uncharacterized protein n=1 Tax=Botryosphaeria dothidea TaxID=55169 RepID=A0A8H4IX72_9PEZI|nr:hypothetical protein GTA08_BOTSDO04686 [Botryosphaeria dothidea]